MKMADIKELSQEELKQKNDSLKEEVFNLKFQFATGQFNNVAKITQIKKDIARIKTAMSSMKNQASK